MTFWSACLLHPLLLSAQRMFLDKDLSEQLSAEFKRWARDRERGVPSTPMDVSITLNHTHFEVIIISHTHTPFHTPTHP